MVVVSLFFPALFTLRFLIGSFFPRFFSCFLIGPKGGSGAHGLNGRIVLLRFPMRIEAQCRNFRFWLTLTKNENKLSQIAYNDIKWNENKAFRSKKIKSLLEQIGLGELWMKAHYADIGIVNMIRQRLKDIELQRWLMTTPEKMLTKATKCRK